MSELSVGSEDLELWAISPLDGRYRGRLAGLDALVSEAGLIRYRTLVELEWILHLAQQPEIAPSIKLTPAVERRVKELISGLKDPSDAAGGRFAAKAAARVKAIEATTNHDVKAVEYYLREELQAAGATKETLAFLHFACTSEDINNLSYALMLKDLRHTRVLPTMDKIITDIAAKAEQYAALPMLSRTHGQTASPTTLGKELAVFGKRLRDRRDALERLPLEGKMNGAVGNYNAHLSAYPELEWPRIAQEFVENSLRLAFNPLTTQIENHDSFVEFGTIIAHFNTILIGFARDMWSYISIGYFKQRAVAGEVGSSTMPHKVNPIDFENAEGNLGLANALATHFADKLPISRWQRDLSDSTVLRALGTMVGHSELAWKSLLKGLGKVAVDEGRLRSDLDQAWEVLAEPIQTVMRRYGVVDAYERLKEATRGKSGVTRDGLLALIDSCKELPFAEKDRLKALTPATYVGCAEHLAKQFATSWKAHRA